MTFRIFCPQCDTLLLAQATCPNVNCRWRRPAERAARKGTITFLADLKAKPHSAPLLAEGILYFGMHTGHVLALDAGNGEARWSQPIPASQLPSPSLVAWHGLLYIGMEREELGAPGSALLALDARSGQERWRVETRSGGASAPVLAGPRLFFAAADGQAYAVAADSGRLIWCSAVESWSWSPHAPAVGLGLMCLPARGPAVVALRVEDGREAWRFTVPDGASWCPTQPALAEDGCYIASWDHRVYSLDPYTGRLRWSFAAEAPMLTRPVLHDKLILVGSQDHRLYAVERANGRLSWSHDTGARVLAAPVVVDGVVYVAAADGRLHALEAATGKPLAKPWELNEPVTLDLTYEERFVAVLTRTGRVFSLAVRDPEPLRSGAEYEALGAWEQAAAAYALAGNLLLAARTYDKYLEFPQRAAQLYEAAGDAEVAAVRYLAAARFDDARRIYRALDDHLNLARIAEKLGELQEAASNYERAREWARAAECYERLGQTAKAAELYVRAGNLQKARQLFAETPELTAQLEKLCAGGRLIQAAQLCETYGQFAQAADLYRRAGELARAGDALMQMDDFRRAAELYEQARPPQPLKAAQAYRQAREWDRAIALFRENGKWEEAAACYEARGDLHAAATLLASAAEQIETQSRGREAVRIAELFERAAGYFAREYDRDAVRRCTRKVRYYRRQPLLDLVLERQEHFISGQANLLTLRISNEGRDVARDVQVELVPSLAGYLEGQLSRAIEGVPPQGMREVRLNVEARNAGELTVNFELTYHGAQGEEFRERWEDWPIEIRQVRPATHFTPEQIIMVGQGGQYFQGQQIHYAGGDLLEAGAQKGDRVEISRGSRPPSAAPIPTSKRCPQCRRSYPPAAEFCEDCGTRLTS